MYMELEDIEREKFDRSLAKCQIRPPLINCAIRYNPSPNPKLMEFAPDTSRTINMLKQEQVIQDLKEAIPNSVPL